MAEAVVLDANVPVRAILDGNEWALDAFDAWNEAGIQILAPELWLPEALTAVRRAVYAGSTSPEVAERAVEGLFKLPVRAIRTDRDLGHAALRWADRIGQAKVYDSLYLAIAERHEVPFVTTDERLLDRCRQLGIDFVQGLPKAAG